MYISEIKHDGKILTMMTPEDLAEAGVPQAVIDDALAAIRVGEIKDECRRRIYAVASAETQMNMATASAVIGGKTASSRSAEETATLAATGMAIGWVSTMKATIAALAADPDSDFIADASWTDCPAEVLALVEQF